MPYWLEEVANWASVADAVFGFVGVLIAVIGFFSVKQHWPQITNYFKSISEAKPTSVSIASGVQKVVGDPIINIYGDVTAKSESDVEIE